MENSEVNTLKEALVEVRKAHRLVYSFQERMLSLIDFIRNHLDFQDYSGVKHFSKPIRRKIGEKELVIYPTMWAWDFLYSYVFEYFIGSCDLDDGSKIQLSLVQYADTGFFDAKTDDRLAIADFVSPEKSTSKLLFIMAHTPKGKKSAWGDNWNYLDEYILNKEYASSRHKTSVITPQGPSKTKLLLYSVTLENFVDERTSMDALKKYLLFLRKNEIELELV